MSDSPKKAQNKNGKGDKPRNCFSDDFKDNFDLIDWQEGGKKEKDKGHRFRKTY
jgi:hypothetical protein